MFFGQNVAGRLEETDFGQSRFGHPDLTNPIFWPIFLVSWWGPKGRLAKPRKSGGPEGWAPEGWGAKPRKSEGPEGWGPKGWGPGGWGPKNSRFFFPLPPQFFFFFSLSFGFFRGILVVFEAPGPSNVHVWSYRAVVEPRRPGLVGPPGFHTTTREPKRVSVFLKASPA